MNAHVTEFQCIMPLENIPSVLKLGILSNERAAKVPHYSVALEVVQERRELKHVPGGLKLHQIRQLVFSCSQSDALQAEGGGGEVVRLADFDRSKAY